MLVRASGLIHPGLHLLTIGNTCRYIIGAPQSFILTDPGLSGQAELLEQRLRKLGFSTRGIRQVVLTHLHADRLGGVAALRRAGAQFELLGTALMAARLKDMAFIRELWEEDRELTRRCQLPHGDLSAEAFGDLLQPDRTITESELLEPGDDLTLRIIPAPGHTPESLAVLVQPSSFLIVDEGFGFFQGRNLAAPGGDDSLQAALASITRCEKLDLAGLALPDSGVLTGQLARRHLAAVIQNTGDLVNETERAKAEGIPFEEIRGSIRDSFYRSSTRDPVLLANLDRTFAAVCRQLGV